MATVVGLALGAVSAGAAAPNDRSTGTLTGYFTHVGARAPASHQKGTRHEASRVHPIVILTAPSGRKQRLTTTSGGRFFARLKPGRYKICDTLGATRCGPASCPVVILGHRFGPAGESAPVKAIAIIGGVHTHVKIDCGR
jgi:hypothetical protein